MFNEGGKIWYLEKSQRKYTTSSFHLHFLFPFFVNKPQSGNRKVCRILRILLQIESTNAKQELTIWKLYKCSTWKNGCLTIGKIPWRRKWQSTPVLLLQEAYGQRSLADCSPWDPKESDTTQWLKHSNSHCMGTARTMVLAKTKRCPKSSKSF